MSESKELVAAEQPQQLINIEPAEYVAQVFEPFAKRLTDAKELARTTTYDVTTAAGMAAAVKIRATFRDIRVESEKARKIRKAPILEIGKLLDSRQKEIEAEIEPLESEPDLAIKAEEARKEAEKAARLAAAQARIDFIRKRIGEIQAIPAESVGRSAADLAATIELTETLDITLEEFAEFAGECEMAKIAALAKLKEMLQAQQAVEQAVAEAARQAEADRIERERVAEANRVEAKRLADLAAELERQAKEARDKQAEADRLAQEQREAADREAQTAREEADRIAAAKLAERQAEMDRQQAAIDAAKAEQDRIAREAREAEAAARQLEADHAEALVENVRIDAERAAAFEAQQQEARRRADEAERIRREHTNFVINGPGDAELVRVIAEHYDVELGDAMEWFKKFDYAAADEHFAAANVAANRLEKAA